MSGFKIRAADGAFSQPSAVKYSDGNQLRDASAVRVLSGENWVKVYPDKPTEDSAGNYVYTTEGTLQTVANRVNAGQQPFQAAYNRLINRADAALGEPLRAVTDGDGDHQFAGHDGPDRDALMAMNDAARNCGLAYWFTGDDAYAEKVIDVVYHWCLNPNTYRTPTTNDTNQPFGINLFNREPAIWYGASFVRGHPHWGTKSTDTPWKGGSVADAEAAFREWLVDRSDYREHTPDWAYNNQYMWMIADMASVAAYLEDGTLMEEAKGVFRADDPNWTTLSDGSTRLRPWNDWRNREGGGFFAHERNRDDGFGYTRYNLNAMTCALTAFESWDGTDLWTFHAPTDDVAGSTVRKAFDWYAPYVENPGSWEWGPSNISSGSVDEAGAVFELSNARWGDYDSVVNAAGGRPHDDGRHLGHQTLTHAVD